MQKAFILSFMCLLLFFPQLTGQIPNFAAPGQSYSIATGAVATTRDSSGTTNITANSPQMTATINGNSTTCQGSTATFQCSASNYTGNLSFQWQKNGINVTTCYTGIPAWAYVVCSPANGDVIRCIVTSDAGGSATSNSITITTTPPQPFGVSVGPNTIYLCQGASVTFSAGSSDPITSYQWSMNGATVSGATSSTFTTTASSVAQLQSVSVYATTSASCKSNSSATGSASTIPFTVDPVVTASVSISSNTGTTICPGATVTFTATSTNGGSSPGYQWLINGAAVSGATSSTYSTSGLTNGQQVNCQMTSSTHCATPTTASSNTLTMTVSSPVTPSVSIAASTTTSCPGQAVTFTATPTNGGSTPTYIWKLNGNTISGATGSTYTSSSLSNGNQVSCTMNTSAPCYTTSQATSNTITMTVNPLQTMIATISGSTTVCQGTSATFQCNVTNYSGNLTFQWQKNGVNVTSDIANIPASAYVTTSPVNGDVIRCIVTTDAQCYVSTATSNSLTITTTPPQPFGVSVGPDNYYLCQGATVTFSAGSGDPISSYQWSMNGSAVSGATSSTFTTTASSVAQLKSVQVYATTNASCKSNNSATGNASTIPFVVDPVVTASVSISSSAGSSAICAGTSVTFTVTPTNGGSSPAYQWYINGAAVSGATSSGFSTSSLTNGQQVSCQMTSSIHCASPVTSNIITTTVTPTVGTPAVPSGNLTLSQGSGPTTYTTSASNATGYNWSITPSSAGTIDGNGTVTWNSSFSGKATIAVTANGCNGPSTASTVDVSIKFDNQSGYAQGLGGGIADPVITDTIYLVKDAQKTTQYQPDTYSSAHTIQNVVALRVVEETPLYIPGDFTATAVVKIEYGHTSTDIYQVDSTELTVSYTKDGGNKYNAIKYLSFTDAEFTRVTVVRVAAPITVNGVSFDTKQVLLLTNMLAATRYYVLADNKRPVLSYTAPATGTKPDELPVSWSYPLNTGNNGTQLEWAWLESEMAAAYTTGSQLDTSLLFNTGATRVDLPGGAAAGAYNIPLLYDGVGTLFMRARAINTLLSGSRSDGPWSAVQTFAFSGHNDSLNWQVTTTYGEEGKRKTVIQYYDGSLRPRQTVTRDNSTNTTVVAETMYDVQGREAIQLLPAPGINNIIAYTKNLNKFNTQSDNTDPTDFFDFTTPSLGKYGTTPLNDSSGAAKYYSTRNPDLSGPAYNKNIPAANGFAYTVTRYTPDATGRVLLKSGVGDSLQAGSKHATRFYYGSAAREELNALFGTEVGNYTHYFKNMVQDANGQMSVSYVDMQGRTIATALAGQAPASLQALNTNDQSQYPNQAGKMMTRNLLDKGSNILKGNSIESINSILVPFNTLYTFNYQLQKQTLQLPVCSGGTVSYTCKFDLEIAVSDESGDTTAFVYRYPGIDSINFTQGLVLPTGSYAVRKTLTINQDSLQSFMNQYATEGVGICRTQQFLIDSIAAADSSASGCGLTTTPMTCDSCLRALKDYTTFLFDYATSLGLSVAQLSVDQVNDIRNQYVTDSLFCVGLNTNTSHTLDNIRKQMVEDMVPYSGQYASDQGSGTMYNKYNIFSTTGGVGSQPYYKYPQNAAGANDVYYTPTGNPDTTVTSTKLATLPGADFEASFIGSWATSLLPHHPEYSKLRWAENNLRTSYDFIDSLNQSVSTAFDPLGSDPYFNQVSTADKTTMSGYVNSSWQSGLSMWQLGYGNALGCQFMADSATRNNCYGNMPKQLSTVGTQINTGINIITLTNDLQSQAWAIFKGLYSGMRSDMVSRYINLHTDTTDNSKLIEQGYRLYFPYDNVQQAQNNGWTDWYPDRNGNAPVISIKDSAKAYTSSKCAGYINNWRQALLQCPALAGKDPATLELILGSITGKMLQVCQNGTDGNNPYGSSTVSPANSGATFTSFEQAVNTVMDSLNIPRDQYCHPYGIGFPRPWGTNQPVTRQYIAAVDTCVCTQYARLKAEITAAGGNIYSLASVNQYLRAIYNDTITPVLYQALQQCAPYYLANCYGSYGGGAARTEASVPSSVKCDTLYALPLASAQPLPLFLACGFRKLCYSCSDFVKLDSTFNTIFHHHPVFGSAITADSTITWNNLFAQYVNFKTGLGYNWDFYAAQFAATGCPIGGLAGSGAGLSVCLNNTPLNDTTGFFHPDPPCQQVRNRATVKAQQVYEWMQQQSLAAFTSAYMARCLAAAEQFRVTDTVKEYHYTLYYYDQAGNLIKTVPPKGVNPIYRQSFIDSVEMFRSTGSQLVPAHSLVTRYCYNSLNQVNIQKTPDAGVSRFWYDRLGRLAVTQNAKQAGQGNVYSYTMYDALSRSIEVGQLTGVNAMTDAVSRVDTSLQSWLNGAAPSRKQIIQTVYDVVYGAINGVMLNQQNLRNRVSYTQIMNNASDPYPAGATYYSYDIHGNVDTLMQDFGNSLGIANAMNSSGNRFKKVVYDFDLISGKVNQLSYQPGESDAYYQRYAYDAENRITNVYSGRDSVMLLFFPEREARYTYYKHTPLARTDIGQLQVQKLDYAYTLQGWLKAINPAMGGTLANGTDTTEASPIAQDVYGFSLNYYDHDYKAIGYTPQSATILGALSTNAAPLFNGNIATMAVNIPKLGSANAYNYHYDQLNRIVAMDAYNGLTPTTGTFTGNSITDYRERVSFDPNGNILTYQRNGNAARPSMDNLGYYYTPTTNRLHKVVDAAPDAAQTDYSKYNDIKQGQTDNNYQYDAIGNLTADNSEGITGINWTVYGRMASINKGGTQIAYVYDASGNRIFKQTVTDTTIYVRDASGNVLCVYTKKAGGTLQQKEMHLYGSSRLGIATQHTTPDTMLVLSGAFGMARKSTFTRGEKLFELTNHLGNVLVTITDRRQQNSAAGHTVDYYTADITNARDYYPFGMQMPGRTYADTNNYRYGYNGKENDNDVKGNGNEVDFGERIYDPRIGRWLSVDPLRKDYEDISPYVYGLNNPNYFIDEEGEFPKPSEILKKIGLEVSPFIGGLLDGIADASPIGAFGFAWDLMTDSDFRSDVWNGLKAVATDPIGTLRQILGDKVDAWVAVLSGNGTDAQEYSVGNDVGAKLLGVLTGAAGAIFKEISESQKIAKAVKKVEKAAVKLEKEEHAIVQAEKSVKKSMGCFAAGTPVLTTQGLKSIENVQVGDSVFAYSDSLRIWEKKVVVNKWVRTVNAIVIVTINGEKITTTEEHPFYISHTWKNAKDLKAGDSTFTYNKGKYIVQKVEPVEDSVIEVYNFTVKDFNSYCVGKSAILVHNSTGNPCAAQGSGNTPKKVKPGNVPHEQRDPIRKFTKKQIDKKHADNNELCEYCGKKTPREKYRGDHKKPHAKGGATNDANHAGSCEKCNLEKSDKEIGTGEGQYNPPVNRTNNQ